MERKVHILKGVGPTRISALQGAGIETIGDLLFTFPRRYLDRQFTEENDLTTDRQVTLVVRVINTYLAHGRKSRFIVHCRTSGGTALSLVFFQSVGYFRSQFKEDETFVVSGKLDYYKGLQMTHPEFEMLDQDDRNLIHTGRIVPLYSTGDALKKCGLDSRGLRRLIAAALDDNSLHVLEPLPEELLARRELPTTATALQAIHFPPDETELNRARNRFIYEELFLFHHLIFRRRQIREQMPREQNPVPAGQSKLFDRLLERLPFRLTGDQKRALEEIMGEFTRDHVGACLLQGDVGSGKTVVALAVALHYIERGIQTALMAPTEVLARQHYRTISELLGLQGEIGLELLLGQDRKKAREAALDRIATGQSNLVIGTHALLEESVSFARLGLAVIDEQHRFGVEQRETLRRKGGNPDLIVMTATPIPRTLSLSAFADLTLVTLREKPAGRGPVQTIRLTEDRRQGMYRSIRQRAERGLQTYIVYPVIDKSEKIDLRAATLAREELQHSVFPDFRVELLHGRLKPDERERVMNDFREGSIQILVTTTVIEVGVDIPNAVIMVIEHAERFGISQLHQLRGRIGRGGEESFCVLVADEGIGEEAERRLQAVVESNDGFHLAEVDMEIRGPGEVLGLKQHGLPGFRLADLIRDKKLSREAYEDCRQFTSINDTARERIRNRFPDGIVVYPA